MKACSDRENIRDRPYIIINCAMSIDGKIALPSKKPVKLSSLEDFRRVHELRNYCDAILVGINTILIDDPKLTVKSEFVMKPKNPIRIVLDTHGQTPKSANVLDESAKTFIIMGDKYKNSGKEFKNAEIIYCPMNDKGLLDLTYLMGELLKNNVLNLLVEGGETVIFNFIKTGLVDELSVYISSKIIGGKASPTMAGGEGFKIEDDLKEFKLFSAERLGDGVLLKYLPDN